jgi:hypothetical protein
MSEQAIDSKGIPNAKDIGRRVAIKADANVKIDLLRAGDTIASTGVEQLAVSTDHWEPGHILSEQKRAFVELSLDRERRLIRVSVHRVGWREKIRHHTGDRPPAAQFD